MLSLSKILGSTTREHVLPVALGAQLFASTRGDAKGGVTKKEGVSASAQCKLLEEKGNTSDVGPHPHKMHQFARERKEGPEADSWGASSGQAYWY